METYWILYEQAEASSWTLAVNILALMAVILLLALHYNLFATVRIYNWNGTRYRYVGRSYLHARGRYYFIKVRKSTVRVCTTTRYYFGLPRDFVRRNKYKDFLITLGKTRVICPVEDSMEHYIYGDI